MKWVPPAAWILEPKISLSCEGRSGETGDADHSKNATRLDGACVDFGPLRNPGNHPGAIHKIHSLKFRVVEARFAVEALVLSKKSNLFGDNFLRKLNFSDSAGACQLRNLEFWSFSYFTSILWFDFSFFPGKFLKLFTWQMCSRTDWAMPGLHLREKPAVFRRRWFH